MDEIKIVEWKKRKRKKKASDVQVKLKVAWEEDPLRFIQVATSVVGTTLMILEMANRLGCQIAYARQAGRVARNTAHVTNPTKEIT